MGSEIVPIRPGLEINNSDHAELIHLFDRLGSQKREKIKDILRQLAEMESNSRPEQELDENTSHAPRTFLLQESPNRYLHCVLVGSTTTLQKGALVLIPNGKEIGMPAGARTFRVAIEDNRFILNSNEDFRERNAGETVKAIVTGYYTTMPTPLY